MEINFFKLASRTRYIIAVDIGSRTLKVAGLRLGQKPSVFFYSVAGLAKDAAEIGISEQIKTVLRDNNVAYKDAVLIFSDDSIAIRRIELPHMAQNEIAGALKWQAKDIVRFDIEKASLDFEVLAETQKEDGAKLIDLVFVAVSRESVDKKVRILKEAGLSVVAVSAPPFGIENIIKLMEGPAAGEALAVVDFGASKAEVSIFRNRRLEFTRVIPVGSASLTDSIAASPIVTEKGNVEISREEAEKMKAELGISYEEKVLDNGVSSLQITSLMRPALERLSKEIKRSIDYFAQEYGTGDVKEVLLAGGGAKLKNLDKFLSEELALPAKRMELPKAIAIEAPNFNNDDIVSVMPLIGAALGHDKGVNLLPHEYRSEKVEFVEKISLRIIAIATVLILLTSFLFIKLRINDYTNRLKTIQMQRSVMAQVRTLQEIAAERMAFLNQVRGSEIPVDYIMKELSNIIPSDMVLDSLRIYQKGKTLDMKGIVYEKRGVAEGVLTRFTEALEKSRYFKEAQIGSVQAVEMADKIEASSFDITCSLE